MRWICFRRPFLSMCRLFLSFLSFFGTFLHSSPCHIVSHHFSFHISIVSFAIHSYVNAIFRCSICSMKAPFSNYSISIAISGANRSILSMFAGRSIVFSFPGSNNNDIHNNKKKKIPNPESQSQKATRINKNRNFKYIIPKIKQREYVPLYKVSRWICIVPPLHPLASCSKARGFVVKGGIEAQDVAIPTEAATFLKAWISGSVVWVCSIHGRLRADD